MNNKGRSGESCADCRFFIGGSCRRYQPLQIPGKSIWPSVSPADWCGEWAPDKITALRAALVSAEAYAETYAKYEPKGAASYVTQATDLHRKLKALIG